MPEEADTIQKTLLHADTPSADPADKDQETGHKDEAGTSVAPEASVIQLDARPKEAELSQAELIKMAFADDDVHDEFRAEKEAEVAQELPKAKEISLLPGWGRWKDEQKEPRWMGEQRAKNQRSHSIFHL